MTNLELVSSLHMQGDLSDKVFWYLIPFDKAILFPSFPPTSEPNLSLFLTLIILHQLILASVSYCMMDSVDAEIKDVGGDLSRPGLSRENQIVSSYLEQRSEVYRDLVNVQDDVSEPKLFITQRPFVDLSNRGGTVPKQPPTSKSSVIRQTTRKQTNSKCSIT